MTRITRDQLQAAMELYGAPPQPRKATRPKRTGPTPESVVLRAVLHALRAHPKVAWRARMNVGVARYKDAKVAYGFTGLADIIGQLTDGRFLAVEVKAKSGVVSEAQHEFLLRVRANGGVAFVAYGVEDIVGQLG